MSISRLALYRDVESLLAAAAKLKAEGFEQLTLISPIPLAGVEKILGKKRSAIKYFSFYGALLGALCGFSLAAGTAILYIIPTGGRPIIPFPPYLIITYEFTILLGVVSTLIGFFVSARLPALRERNYAVEVSVDRFALVVSELTSDQAATAEVLLEATGAEEIRVPDDENEKEVSP